MILPAQFVQVGNFSGGLARVKVKTTSHGDADKWGYINKAGKFVWKSLEDNSHPQNGSGSVWLQNRER